MVAQPDIHSDLGKRVLVIGAAGEDAKPGAGEDAVPGHSSGKAGPAWALAEALSLDHDVILAVPRLTKDSHPRFAVVYYSRRNIGLLARDSDVVIFSPAVLEKNPVLQQTGFLAAASRQAVIKGQFQGTRLSTDAAAMKKFHRGELLVLHPVACRAKKAGPSYYIARLRNYLARLAPR